ncbi:MAG: class I SAM-dependent methyltransferase [Methanomicrobia archaeon]|nr:class I SAM-dependent methyltransferase [Methanomicrobia archaeon]
MITMKDIANKYDKTAPFYNKRYREIQEDKYKKMIDFPVKGKILDIGCGTGLLYDFLKYENYTGMDISLEMLKKGGFAKKILGDCEFLPFKSCVFDFVFSFTVLQNLPSYKMISEAYRVLKNGGIFVLTTLKKTYKEDLINALRIFKMIDKKECGEDIGFILKKAF